MAVSKAQIRANTRYRQRHFLSLNICFHKEHDKNIVDRLNGVSNKTDYIRELIAKDLSLGETDRQHLIELREDLLSENYDEIEARKDLYVDLVEKIIGGR